MVGAVQVVADPEEVGVGEKLPPPVQLILVSPDRLLVWDENVPVAPSANWVLLASMLDRLGVLMSPVAATVPAYGPEAMCTDIATVPYEVIDGIVTVTLDELMYVYEAD